MLPEKHHKPVDGFRWRSHEITRIEGFSDAVFGFAVTLLIVSLEVPRTSTELLATMRGFGAFVVTFLMLAGMWYMQHTFFRRYGLEDRVTVILNLALLFTVLFFVYPLKFLFTTMFANPRMKGMVVTAHGLEPIVLPEHRGLIFLIFGAGFTAVFTVFALLYRHAYRQRDQLKLNEFEIYETTYTLRRLKLAIGVGVTYFAVAAMETMPRVTAADKNRLLIVNVVIMIVLAALMTMIARAWNERRRVTREWKRVNSSAEPSDVSAAER